MRVKGVEPPDLPDNLFLTANEISDDMSVTHNFVVDGCFKRDEDAEGNYYAWYYVKEYERVVDKSPGLNAEIERLTTENEALQAHNTMLEDCIMEMSEIIYA